LLSLRKNFAFGDGAEVIFLVHFSFPISKFPRRRRPFLNFHTALLMIATQARTHKRNRPPEKKFAFSLFASRKFSPSAFGDGAEVIF